MNQKEFAKAFAIFVGAVMVLSAFAGFVLRSGDVETPSSPESVETAPLSAFGVRGNLVDMSFSSMQDLLEMCPENTTFAYWIDLEASQNITDAAASVIPEIYPPAAGLMYRDKMYPTEIRRGASVFFNGTWAEFHWIMPFTYNYQGLVIPYNDFMIVPATGDLGRVFGRPTLFGPEGALKQILDVILGGFPTDRLTLAYDEIADLQIAGVGGIENAPLGGEYEEFYAGITQRENDVYVRCRFLSPAGNTLTRIQAFASKYNMSISRDGSILRLDGTIAPEEIRGVIADLLAP
ncbi:MAG: hypothetical protein H5T42_04800 [Methanothrix sp.]|uniref:Uncharacterized protein n=1 Tax=Methanothrix thermoacetophila (strain DSM 6194 / JCM 14653 / NBRC 101360 / PT) TaxID=349307 RepID=A0B600_METTP|nr:MULTISPECIES: hypothetical protein [Methanothrix]ABK14124.1 hypothetical protein Mthe_0330 [Methanothrix thermoacetophila PT]MBC7079772.1 hypothetical protein [Methanothrix sp.]NPU87849.1 hypothetical protein [Methanothrix sp.]